MKLIKGVSGVYIAVAESTSSGVVVESVTLMRFVTSPMASASTIPCFQIGQSRILARVV